MINALLMRIADPPIWALGFFCVVFVTVLYLALRKDHFFALMLGSLVALSLGEGVCRITNLGNTVRAAWKEETAVYRDSLPVYEPGGRLVYCYPDNPRGYFDERNEVHGTINSKGFRGKETTVEKQPGAMRVAFLGDSFTIGIGVRDEDTLPANVERELGKEYVNVEVLNFGVSRSRTPFQIKFLEDYVLRFEPDIVVILLFSNDAGWLGTRQFMTAPFLLARLRKHSYFMNALAGELEKRFLSRRMIRYYQQCFTETSPGFRRMKDALQKGNALSRERGFRFVAALYPVLFRLQEDYPFKAAHAALATFCHSESKHLVHRSV